MINKIYFTDSELIHAHSFEYPFFVLDGIKYMELAAGDRGSGVWCIEVDYYD